MTPLTKPLKRFTKMISDKHKFIFIHPPKCGGTYITNHLLPFSEDYARPDDAKHGKTADSIRVRRPDDAMHNHFGMTYMHAGAHELCNYLGKKKFKEYYSFACVRNPFERLISVYFWGTGGRFDKKVFFNDVSPPYDPANTSVWWRYNKRTDRHYPSSTVPLDYFLLDLDGEMLVDYVFDISNMKEGLEHVSKKIGIKPSFEERKHNTSSHTHYSHYYDQEMIDYISETYKWEIDTFNYTFDDKRDEER